MASRLHERTDQKESQDDRNERKQKENEKNKEYIDLDRERHLSDYLYAADAASTNTSLDSSSNLQDSLDKGLDRRSDAVSST